MSDSGGEKPSTEFRPRPSAIQRGLCVEHDYEVTTLKSDEVTAPGWVGAQKFKGPEWYC